MKIIVNKSELARMQGMVAKHLVNVNVKFGMDIELPEITTEMLKEITGVNENRFSHVELIGDEIHITLDEEFSNGIDTLVDAVLDVSIDFAANHKLSLAMLAGVLKRYVMKTVIPDVTEMVTSDKRLTEFFKGYIGNMKSIITEFNSKFKRQSN